VSSAETAAVTKLLDRKGKLNAFTVKAQKIPKIKQRNGRKGRCRVKTQPVARVGTLNAKNINGAPARGLPRETACREGVCDLKETRDNPHKARGKRRCLPLTRLKEKPEAES